MSVVKFIELSAQSAQGYEDAVRQAVQRASSMETGLGPAAVPSAAVPSAAGPALLGGQLSRTMG